VRISVVIPTHNRAHTLQRCLDSVLKQSEPADEVIVVDDGSDDDSLEVLARFPDIDLIRQENKGVSAARNSGIEAASGDWIALLDSDDEWLPHKLETIRRAQTDNPDIHLFHSDEIWIRNGVRVNPMNKHSKYGGDIFRHCLPLCVISPSAAVIRRDLFDEVGLFDPALPACEDYDLWLRICQRHPVHYSDEALIVKHGGHEDQLSRRHWGMDRFRIRTLDRLLRRDTLNPQQHELALDMMLHKLGILLKGARKHDNRAVIDEFEPLQARYRSETC
jgi:glycosyltransferase involved in cell wall biosynthesis